jgi:hypothetical protein
MVMKEKTEIMVALAAAIGANCIPCFDHQYEKAKGLGLTNEEVFRIAETAHKVKTGASSGEVNIQFFAAIAVNIVVGTNLDPCYSSGDICLFN